MRAAAILIALWAPSMQAQGAPGYTAAQLHCTRWLESSNSDIETETAGGALHSSAVRRGVWSFRARDSLGAVALETWYDSLQLSRRASNAEIRADTDGLIGGRYRGLLKTSGEYVEIARPFVPDEVAELADVSVAAHDLLPPLPPRPLRPGQSWTGAGLTLERLPDTSVAGRPLLHLRLESRLEDSTTVPRGDTVAIPIRQTTVEQGHIYWSPARGLVRRIRHITIDAAIPTGGRIRQPVRSRVVQDVELTRLPADGSCL